MKNIPTRKDLLSQGQRVQDLLRGASAQQQQVQPSVAENITALLSSGVQAQRPGGEPLRAFQESLNSQEARRIGGAEAAAKTEADIYNILKQQRDQGNQEAGQMLSAIEKITGGDVAKSSQLLNEINKRHPDGEAGLAEAINIATELGIKPAMSRKDQLELRKLEEQIATSQAQRGKITAETRAMGAKPKIKEADVKAFSKRADEMAELVNSVDYANNLLKPYVTGKDIPGFGQTKLAPDVLVSKEGQDIRQAVSAIRNSILKARSGGAVTPQESERLLEEIGEGAAKTDRQLVQGLNNVTRSLNAKINNLQAGFDPDVVSTYTRRGGGVKEIAPLIQEGAVDVREQLSQIPPAFQQDPRVLEALQSGYSIEEIMGKIGG